MSANIRDAIVAKRHERIARLGFAEGAVLPARRETPLVPFLGQNGLICEVKRKSPSKGDIAPGLDAVAQARLYVNAGAGNLSVLTEPEGFGGSIDDMMAVKRNFPKAAVLRKDFLFDVHDIDVAWRAGADAVLLIAGMLSAERLHQLYRCAKGLGMEALVEVHDAEDLEKAAYVKPNLVGVNSRDLTTFAVDPLLPLRVRAGLTWDCRVVYESGIHAPDQAAFAVASGFDGILVGEGVVRDPELAGRLLAAMAEAKPARFWKAIGEKLYAVSSGTGERWRPLVKVCGLTRAEDAALAADLGADALGFVFYEKSPRRASPEVVRAAGRLDALKIGVVVAGAGREIPPEAKALLDEGFLDALQLHGEETPDQIAAAGTSAYKAIKPRDVSAVARGEEFRCPRVLVDAAAEVSGGSGQRVDEAILAAWKKPLWLAGGITPDTVAEIVAAWKPELVDLASGVEEAPGVKSPALLKKFFTELGRTRPV